MNLFEIKNFLTIAKFAKNCKFSHILEARIKIYKE